MSRRPLRRCALGCPPLGRPLRGLSVVVLAFRVGVEVFRVVGRDARDVVLLVLVVLEGLLVLRILVVLVVLSGLASVFVAVALGFSVVSIGTLRDIVPFSRLVGMCRLIAHPRGGGREQASPGSWWLPSPGRGQSRPRA